MPAANRIKRHSTFYYLLLTSLCIFIPVATLGSIAFVWSMDSVRGGVTSLEKAHISSFLSELEDEFKRIEGLQYECLNDYNLQKLNVRHEMLDRFEMAMSVNQLVYHLRSIQESSAYISDVTVYMPSIGRMISSVTLMDPIDDEEYLQIRSPKNGQGVQFVRNNDGDLFLSTLRQDTTYSLLSGVLISIEIDTDKLKQALRVFTEQHGKVLFANMEGSFLFSEDQESSVYTLRDFLPGSDLSTIGGNYLPAASDGECTIDGRDYVFLCEASDYFNSVLLVYYPRELLYSPVSNIALWLTLLSIVFVSMLILFWFVAYRLIHLPLTDLVAAFLAVQAGDTKIQLHKTYGNEYDYLFEQFNQMTRKISSLINQVYRQKIAAQQAELKQLQSQINPHFLYNSFFTINTMARLEDENLIPFTQYLGEYFQYITRNAAPFIRLSDEIKHARTYTNIQKMRYGSRLQVDFEECPDEIADLRVPRLVLQPVLENTFKYVVDKRMSLTVLRVSFRAERQYAEISAEDNGDTISDEQIQELQRRMSADAALDGETTGLVNVHRRLCLLYGEGQAGERTLPVGIKLARSDLGGMNVMLTINRQGGSEDV